jgi:hypothetical protein
MGWASSMGPEAGLVIALFLATSLLRLPLRSMDHQFVTADMIELVSSPAWQHPAASHPASGERSWPVPYPDNRSRSIWRRSDVIWFQLAKVRVTTYPFSCSTYRSTDPPSPHVSMRGPLAPTGISGAASC